MKVWRQGRHTTPLKGLTSEALKQELHYDPETGVFKRLTLRGGQPIGAIAGSPRNVGGYIGISVCGKTYSAHRLAWLYMTGQWPEFDIDHKDRNKAHNAWSNLRSTDASGNKANSKRPRNSTSGLKGVCWHKTNKKWKAQLRFRGQHIYLGYFASAEEAHHAYCAAAQKVFGEFARAE